MQQIITAIWLQGFDSLQVVNPINILLLLLGMVLFIESSFVLLPLPGVGLGLFVGGLVSTGAVDFYSAVTLLTSASSIIWSMTLLKIGGWFMQKPHLIVYQESITRWFLISSFLLMATVLITLLLRRITLNDSRRTPNSVNHKG